MKVLTIKEPWASMILNGEKTIETRTWRTKYRGLCLLHASKNPRSEISGKIFAVAKIVDCKPMTQDDELPAKCPIYPGAYSFFLEEVRPTELKEIKGQLGLWEINCELVEKGEGMSCLFG